MTITLPPLRERREDIPLLAAHFMKELNARHGKHVTSIAEPVRRAMTAYDWPGNVRELRNFIESMVVLDTDGVLGVDDCARTAPSCGSATARPSTAPSRPGNLVGRPLAEVERYYIEQALALTGGNREEAARMLGHRRADAVPQHPGMEGAGPHQAGAGRERTATWPRRPRRCRSTRRNCSGG